MSVSFPLMECFGESVSKGKAEQASSRSFGLCCVVLCVVCCVVCVVCCVVLRVCDESAESDGIFRRQSGAAAALL